MAALDKPDPKRDGEAGDAPEIGLVARNGLAPLVGLQNHLVDGPGERRERPRVAVRAPVEEAGDRQLVPGRQLRPQPLQEFRIFFEMPGPRIEIDLEPLQAVAGHPPLIETAGDRGGAVLGPGKGVRADDEPYLFVGQARRLRPQRDVAHRAAVADLAVEQIDNPGAPERGRRRHAGPQPESVIFARIDPVGIAAAGAEGHRHQQKDAAPYQ